MFILNSLNEVLSDDSLIFTYTFVIDKNMSNRPLENYKMFFNNRFELGGILKNI